MPAWIEARRAGQSARSGSQAERVAPSKDNAALPQAAERWDKEECIYCGGKSGRRVGMLPITGRVYFCKGHRDQFQADKIWEARHKSEIGG